MFYIEFFFSVRYIKKHIYIYVCVCVCVCLIECYSTNVLIMKKIDVLVFNKFFLHVYLEDLSSGRRWKNDLAENVVGNKSAKVLQEVK